MRASSHHYQIAGCFTKAYSWIIIGLKFVKIFNAFLVENGFDIIKILDRLLLKGQNILMKS